MFGEGRNEGLTDALRSSMMRNILTAATERNEAARNYLIKRRKQDGCKTVHSSPLDYETKNIVSSSDGVSCAEKDETNSSK